MEVGYVGHQDSTFQPSNLDAETSSISMTATMDTLGNLVLGESSIFEAPYLSIVYVTLYLISYAVVCIKYL